MTARAEAIRQLLPLAAVACKLAPKPHSSLEFRGGNLEAQSRTDHEWLLSGPAETGKTVAGLWRLYSLCASTPKAHAAIIRKVQADIAGSVLQTWRRIVDMRGAVTTYGGIAPTQYEFPNGATIFVGGMDRSSKTLSSERDWIYVNQAEELTLDDWEHLTRPTTGRGAITKTPMLFGDCNPGPRTHWILSRSSLQLLETFHRDNPFLFGADGTPEEQWAMRTGPILEALTGVRRDRLLLGKWASAEGVVYDGFDRRIHVIPRFVIPKAWRRVRAIDFGFTNPFVCQWWAIDNDGRAYLYREIYRTRTLVEDHAREIVRLGQGESIEATVADHDAEDRATLERYGVYTIPAEKAVSSGIQGVAGRLIPVADRGPDQPGRPRLFIFEDALVERDEALAAAHRPVCTADEFEVFAWPKDSAGRALKDEPVKVNDHGMDAMRYAVAYLDGVGSAPEPAQGVRVHRRPTRIM